MDQLVYNRLLVFVKDNGVSILMYKWFVPVISSIRVHDTGRLSVILSSRVLSFRCKYTFHSWDTMNFRWDMFKKTDIFVEGDLNFPSWDLQACWGGGGGG